MKQRSTTLVTSGILTKFALVAAAVLMSVATPLALMPKAQADQYSDKINALKSQVGEFQARAGELRQQVNTLQNELNRLAAEKATIQTQIDLSQATYEKLVLDIKNNEQKIADNKEGLGEIIADIQVDEDISPLEMIASSNNIAEYVDKQSYRSSISDNLQQTIDEIAKLKKENEQKKIDVERVLADQKNQREALVAKENESQSILAQTRGEEAAYQQMSASKNAEIAQLQKEQQAAIARAYSGRGGGSIAAGSLPAYASWAGSDCYVDNEGYSHRGYSGNGQDPAGTGCNQCVSYTAWKMGQATGYIPSYWGNANMWPDSARRAGFKVSSTPPGPGERALGVMTPGKWGHIVNVDSVNADGTLNISQYNEWLNGEGGKYGFGHFSTRNNVSPSKYDQYIYY